jgi:hypothetical protein
MTGERAAERVRLDAFVKIHSDAEELVFRTRDLSEQGVFLYSALAQAYPIRVGTTLDLDLDEVSCKAVVVRVVEPGSAEAKSFPTGFAVRITEIDEPSRGKLRALVSRAKTGS